MAANEDMKQYLEYWDSTVRRWSTFKAVGAEMGRSESYVTNALKHEDGSRLGFLLGGLEAAGHPCPPDTFRAAWSKLGTDPTVLLLASREWQNLPADPYLKQAGPRLKALVNAGPTNHTNWGSRQSKIARLDALRRCDRLKAKERVQHMISLGFRRMEKSGELPRQGLGDLSRALGVLAAIHRLGGYRDAAMDALILARPLALLSEVPGAIGHWYQKALYLAVDLKRYDLGYEFAHEALKFFFYSREVGAQARVLVDIGYVLNHAKMPKDAKRTLELALPMIRESDQEYRFGLHQLLAKQKLALGDLQGAREDLTIAQKYVGSDRLADAALSWHTAQLLVSTGEPKAAIAAYQNAIRYYSLQASAGEVAELGLELAIVLYQEKRRSELRSLATDVAGWVHQLKGNRKLRDTIADFAALATMDKLDNSTLLALQGAVKSANNQGTG